MNSIDYARLWANVIHQYAATNKPAQSSIAYNKDTLKGFEQTPNAIVTISQQARDKLLQEQRTIGLSLTQQHEAKQAAKESTINPLDKTKDLLDKLIEDIQKQIKAARRQLSTIRLIKTKQAEAERKALQAKLISLNAMLLQLFSKKLEATT